MFIDETTVIIEAGNGGDGCFSYMREKFKPRGRPSGGNGGRGGHIVVRGDAQLHTLQDIAYRKKYKAEDGVDGRGADRYGHNAPDIVIALPLGTLVYDAETGELLLDCLTQDTDFIIARGGRGGKGNGSMRSTKNPNPQFAEEGKPGEHRRLRFELKVLADVGLVGRPNAGKSTFLSTISAARPTVADYPFTTTRPYLGIVSMPGRHAASFTVADIPGLIEGSSEGKGLGIRFLRHIERTRVLAIMVEASSPDPKADAQMLLDELSTYSEVLAKKPRIFILSKSDLTPPGKRAPRGWLTMSAVTGKNVSSVVSHLWDMLAEIPRESAS